MIMISEKQQAKFPRGPDKPNQLETNRKNHRSARISIATSCRSRADGDPIDT